MEIKTDIPLAPFTTYRIGGNTRYFSEVFSLEDLARTLDWAKERGLPYFILGGGSNILVSDQGFPGLVVRYLDRDFKVLKETGESTEIRVGTGMALENLVKRSIDLGLAGLEWASGIPGLLGGALKIYASAFHGSMKDVVVEIESYCPETGVVKKYDRDSSLFGYKDTIFLRTYKDEVILGTKIRLTKANSRGLKRKANQILFYRDQKHPKEFSCGSVFKNVKDQSFIKRFLESNPEWRDAFISSWHNKIPAGLLIDKAGLRGFRIGGAQISDQHANFIVNSNGAKADDVVQLISIVKDRVQERFGVALENEVRLVGF
jgi:UDP-N-acetylmuramate dehydrogenase